MASGCSTIWTTPIFMRGFDEDVSRFLQEGMQEVRDAMEEAGKAAVQYNIENGDYLKLDNVTLGYTLPSGILPYVKSARVYLAGKNLLCFFECS